MVDGTIWSRFLAWFGPNEDVLALKRLRFLETETSWRLSISLGSGFLRNLNLTGWPKGWVVIPSLSVMKGYNRHMKGFPNMTLSVIFFTRTNVFLKHALSWHTCVLGILNSICICPPLAEVNLSLVFWNYLGGTIPSWIQLRSAPESIRATTSNSKSLSMTILTLECHFWKLIRLMVCKNDLLDGSGSISAVGLTVSSTSIYIYIYIYTHTHTLLGPVWYCCSSNVVCIFWKYVWVKKCLEIHVILFKNWKYVFKHMYQTDPYCTVFYCCFSLFNYIFMF